MDPEIIKVQPQDELTSVIDKLIKTEANRVYLLIPEQSYVAQHVLNLRLLKREADSLGKEVIAVSASPRIQTLALKASLQVHHETEELMQKAEKSASKGASVPSASVVRDIIGPKNSHISTKSVIEFKKKPSKAGRKIVKQKTTGSVAHEAFLKKSQKPKETPSVPKINEYNIQKNDKGDTTKKEGALADFWARRNSSLPKSTIVRFLPRGSFWERFMPKGGRVKRFKYTLAIFVATSFIIAGFTFYSVLPKAKIYVTAFVEDVTLELAVRGDTDSADINTEAFTIPVQIFEKSFKSSKTTAASGNKELREKAKGTIKVYNAYSSAPQTLVETTRFVSEDGKLFRTSETIVVPGAEVKEGKIVPSSTTVAVVAASPGAEYNIGPSSFSIPGFKGTPKYLAFYGESESPIEGGRIGSVKAITTSDYENTEQELRKELTDRASRELELSIQEGFIIPPGARSFSTMEIVSSGLAGDEQESLDMSGSLSVRAFALRESDIIQLLKEDFERRFPGKKLIASDKEIEYKVLDTNFDEGTMRVKVTYTARAAVEISANEVREGVRNKKERDVRAFLSSHPNIKEAKVTFWPFWVNSIPDDVSKIEVIIDP